MERTAVTAVSVAVLVVLSVGVVGAVTTPGAVDDTVVTSMGAQEGENGTATSTPASTGGESGGAGDEAPMGASVSSFMQASAADAENEVESGMFAAKFERSNASEQARLVRQRTDSIQRRVQELRGEREQILSSETVTVAERAKAARLKVRAQGLQRALNQTLTAADRAEVSVDREEVDRIRTDTKELTGPEVAGIATGLAEGKRGERGPPDRSEGEGVGIGDGPDGERTPGNQSANESEGNPGNGQGENAGNGQGGPDQPGQRPSESGENGSGQGPPSEAAPESGGDQGEPGQSGQSGQSDGAESGQADESTATPTPTPTPTASTTTGE